MIPESSSSKDKSLVFLLQLQLVLSVLEFILNGQGIRRDMGYAESIAYSHSSYITVRKYDRTENL